MAEYRAQLDREREDRLSENAQNARKRRMEYSDSDEDGGGSDDSEESRKGKKKKRSSSKKEKKSKKDKKKVTPPDITSVQYMNCTGLN